MIGTIQNNILSILNSCDILLDISNEFKKPFGWIHVFQKSKYNSIKKQLKEKISLLNSDTWSTMYIKMMENTLLSYYNKLSPYLDDITIEDHYINDLTKFKPIYFFNRKSDYSTDVIILDIVSDSINLTIYNTKSGEHIELVSDFEISDIQKKTSLICKKILIDTLNRYVDGITAPDEIQFQNERLIEQVKREFPLDFFEPDIIVEAQEEK